MLSTDITSTSGGSTGDSSAASFPESADRTGQGILLEHITKKYSGQPRAAVDDITMEIPSGELVTLVGPSGCGKTTTLKMINRLIEPTTGRITIGDRDVMSMNADNLRRHIGYVIQGGGLLPHMTVAANIALVPKMLHWPADRIDDRIEELMELISLDSASYRDRYPRELSGGQQQRIGVARALAADPPVLLMDEPFGAVDPLTRQRLQDELLEIQATLHKTIVLVTHDFDEAIKLGDWIAILSEGAHIVQYDTPERILAAPANEFVEGFIGGGAGLKQLTLNRVRDADLWPAVTCNPGDDARTVLTRMKEAGDHNHVVVLDRHNRPLSWPSRQQVERMTTIPDRKDPALATVSEESTLTDALSSMLVSNAGAALITGRRDSFQGVITVEVVMDAITRLRTAAPGADSTPVGGNGSDPNAPDDAPTTGVGNAVGAAVAADSAVTDVAAAGDDAAIPETPRRGDDEE
ncbi:ABC transporter ATP-binding protein [Propionimicrobium sp. PCR01-08-3]|uniref:ABC transporter ATP-binding protein n=1 Tax=Propionimicrobium sp. PCR01-08-3 TaxID=3052086 RepID=UPI00255CB124|nr:ABC transporter ATP-binding protein [Propionimicrobium sp. PCR01-08-3]WIY81459.1 ABC transporter ATP-binding protein [Propionimicrobium sp. PCR01-08-3]